jgi:hypothetical protein
MELALPAVQTLGSETSVIDPILGAATYPDHSAVLDRDVETATVAAEQASGLCPGIDFVGR